MSHQSEVERLFHAACDLKQEQREAFLNAACGEETTIRREVEAMLNHDAAAKSFLVRPVLGEPELLPTTGVDGAEQSGSEIGPYRLMEKIGEGGFGLVFVAQQQTPVRRKVALKIIKPGMDTRDVVARFEAERQALAMMEHPNIAKVLDAGTTPSGRPYVVMELIRGVPIVEYCDAVEMTTEHRLRLFVSVCRAVQHAHSKGVIHRDLKPSNILVSPHDGVPVVKIIDFGIAKAIGGQLTDKTIYTRLTQMIGTPLYMSPEQAEVNAIDVDTRSDVYSLGVLLYELLTGTTPIDKARFSRATYDEIKRIIREEEPPTPSRRLSTLGNTLPSITQKRQTEPAKLTAVLRGELDWIVMCCLEKERSRRYQTAVELASDVERYLNDEPVQVVPPSRFYRAKKYIKRNAIPISIAACVMMVAAAFMILQSMNSAKYQRIAFGYESVLTDHTLNAAANGDLETALTAVSSLEQLDAPTQLTQTLKSLAHASAGDLDEAIRVLEPVTQNPSNTMANSALVMLYYRKGDLVRFLSAYESVFASMTTDYDPSSDLDALFHARATTYAPGNADERAISLLSDVISRHRLWGFAYLARAEAYRDKMFRTKDVKDVYAAVDDSDRASLLLPDSDSVKALALHVNLHAFNFAQANPDLVDQTLRNRWNGKARELADYFRLNPNDWEGLSGAAGVYLANGSTDIANQVLREYESRFSEITTTRDRLLFQERDVKELARLARESPFTRARYALLVFEQQDHDKGLNIARTAAKEATCADPMCTVVQTLLLMNEFGEAKANALKILDSPRTLDLWEWCDFVLQYYADRISEEKLIEMAGPFQTPKCMAHWCIGVDYLARGNRPEARKHFTIVKQTGRAGWGSYEDSVLFLSRMDEDPDWPHWIKGGNE